MRSGSFAEGKSACQSCAVCGLAARSHCSRCQLVHYCGRDCQRTAWRTHKSQCKPAPAPAPASAPAPSPAPTPVSVPASAPVEEKHEAAVVDIEDLTDPRALARIRAQSRRCNCRKCASLCHGTPGIYDPHHIRRPFKLRGLARRTRSGRSSSRTTTWAISLARVPVQRTTCARLLQERARERWQL